MRTVKVMSALAATCALCRTPLLEEQGLKVLGHLICPACESKIVSLTRDDPDYERFKTGLKKIWQRLGA